MQVVEHDQHELLGGEALEEIAHGAMGAEALGRGRPLGRSRVVRAQRGEHRRQLPHVLGGQTAEVARIKRLEILVESVDEGTERQGALELRCASMQRHGPAVLALVQEIEQQPRLADSRFPGDEDEALRARERLAE